MKYKLFDCKCQPIGVMLKIKNPQKHVHIMFFMNDKELALILQGCVGNLNGACKLLSLKMIPTITLTRHTALNILILILNYKSNI